MIERNTSITFIMCVRVFRYYIASVMEGPPEVVLPTNVLEHFQKKLLFRDEDAMKVSARNVYWSGSRAGTVHAAQHKHYETVLRCYVGDSETESTIYVH